ncbi:GLPGLI family protein [Chryseobacterium mucoviscidosis]|uniref:GLPGLI family protein n=1 Tax=Chryseobacterium mucoviscidosis TaxID=1945581 RepID=UPI0031D31055
MKKSFLIFCLFVSKFLFSQELENSNIKCSYLTKFLIDTTNINTKKEEIAGLWIGTKTSIFKSEQKAIYDSLTKESARKSFANPVNGRVILDFSKFRRAYFIPEVFKNGNKLEIFDKVLNITYAYESDQKIEWKLIDETKTISTYKCRKATGRYRNKNITVWYTEEIPISEGPYTFKGLPGLVIEAYDEKDFFHFTLIGLKKVNELIAPIKRNVINTDYQKFSKKRSDYQNDPAGTYFLATGRTTPKELKDGIEKMHRSNNNHLD